MSEVSTALSYLHTVTLAAFGAPTSKLWFPATAGHHKDAASYTEEIPAALAPLTAKAAAGFGLMSMPDDAVVLQATRSAFPFEPRPNQAFILGETAATGRRYVITTVTGSTGLHAHYRILATKA